MAYLSCCISFDPIKHELHEVPNHGSHFLPTHMGGTDAQEQIQEALHLDASDLIHMRINCEYSPRYGRAFE